MNPILKDPRLVIRAMVPSDITSVMEIERRSYEFPWTEGIFRDCIKAGYHCFVYVLNQLVIGYGVLSVAAGEAHILNISIEPQMQRKGLGRRLLGRLLSVASVNGADSVFLEVRRSNQAAQELYLSMGFNELGTRRGYYPAVEGREDAILLGLALVPPSCEA